MDFAALPTWQYVSVGITGMLVLVTSLYLILQGYFLPAFIAVTLAVVLVVTYLRVQASVPSQPPPTQETQFTVFRSMESTDQTRVNPWTGFLQEDVYANPFGPIGTFVGNDDVTPNAPLYPIDEEVEYEAGISARNCPPNNQCTCVPSPDDRRKTHCGYMQNETFIPCPSDCCTPSCTY